VNPFPQVSEEPLGEEEPLVDPVISEDPSSFARNPLRSSPVRRDTLASIDSVVDLSGPDVSDAGIIKIMRTMPARHDSCALPPRRPAPIISLPQFPRDAKPVRSGTFDSLNSIDSVESPLDPGLGMASFAAAGLPNTPLPATPRTARREDTSDTLATVDGVVDISAPGAEGLGIISILDPSSPPPTSSTATFDLSPITPSSNLGQGDEDDVIIPFSPVDPIEEESFEGEHIRHFDREFPHRHWTKANGTTMMADDSDSLITHEDD